MKVYLRTPLHGHEYKVCNEHTDEIIAIFYNKELAIHYINYINEIKNGGSI